MMNNDFCIWQTINLIVFVFLQLEKDKRIKFHQDMTRCIFRIFKTTKADEGQ